jgi:hypothetical protein
MDQTAPRSGDAASSKAAAAVRSGVPSGPAATAPDADAAWAELTGRWDDPAAHRELLAACQDLEALAEVGRRYRGVLEARPHDPMAREMKGEILKRATVIGLSQLPRTRPPSFQSGIWPRRLLLGGTLVVAAALSWMLGRLILGNVF